MDKDAIRIFKTVSKANETCRYVRASVTEQCPEADMEKLWIHENRRTAEFNICIDALHYGTVFKRRKLYHR